MADIVSKSKRSIMMSGIRSKDTRIEVGLRKALFARGVRYRKNVQSLPGKPDIVISKYSAAVFVHGCFWHMHDCGLFKIPATRGEFWESKIAGNRKRDEKNKEALFFLGWRVAVVWECALRGRKEEEIDSVAKTVIAWLASKNRYLEISGSCVSIL